MLGTSKLLVCRRLLHCSQRKIRKEAGALSEEDSPSSSLPAGGSRHFLLFMYLASLGGSIGNISMHLLRHVHLLRHHSLDEADLFPTNILFWLLCSEQSDSHTES